MALLAGLGHDESMPCRGAEHPVGYVLCVWPLGGEVSGGGASTPSLIPDGTEERTETAPELCQLESMETAYPQLRLKDSTGLLAQLPQAARYSG